MSLPLYIQQADGSLSNFMPRTGTRTRNPALLASIFVVAHVPLALVMRQYPPLSTLHAFIVLLLGLRWAASDKEIRRVTCVAAYITGSEVLWRMIPAQVPWEFGKYATGLILIVSLLRNGRVRMPLLMSLYFLLLLPAIVPTAMNYYMTLESVRQLISTNLSGPFALMASAWFFSNVKLTSSELESLFVAVIGPAVGIAVLTLFSTLTSDNLIWGSHSNMVSSGGFGPNQVSGALGLGALMALLLLIRSRVGNWTRILIFLALAFLAIQCALTFSRGGLVGASGAALVSIFYLIQDRQARVKLVLIIAVILVASLIVLPRLDGITGGALSKRFENTNTTGRAEIAESDLRMWDENPIFGVGVGMSLFRDTGWRAAHTEFTRLLAEHGIFGLAAMLLLLFAGWRRLFRTSTPGNKAVVGAMLAWSILFMLDKAMRLVAPSFMFGLAFTTLQPDSQEQRNV